MSEQPAKGALPPPAISIIVPTYNRPRETERAIESIIANVAEVAEINHELIVVDDASEPPFAPSAPLAAQLDACANLTLRIVRQSENKGAAAARNRGVAAAHGSWLAFLDSDDEWAPGKLAGQWRALDPAAPPLIAWTCASEFLGVGRGDVRTPIAGDRLALFAGGCWFNPGSTLLIPAASFARIGAFDERLRRLEDYDWFLRFAAQGGAVRVAPGLARIRIGPRTHLTSVRHAAAIVARKIEAAPGLAGVKGTARAYLHLERARAALSERKYLAFIGFFLASLAAKPRFGVQTHAYWRTSPAAARDGKTPA